MKRTLRFEVLSGGAWPRPGRASVATAFVHPERGPVRCPGAELLGGSLTRRGLAVEYTDWTGAVNAAGDDTAHAVSYVDRQGQVTGLAASVSPGEATAAQTVEAALAEWVNVLRTRQILLAATHPWCSGLRATRNVVDRLAGDGRGTVFVIGDPPPSAMTRPGVVFRRSLQGIPAGARVVVGPGGAGPTVRAEAVARGIELVDSTCPIVAALAEEIRQFAEQGETVMLVADAAHTATTGLLDQAPGQVHLLDRIPSADRLPAKDPARIAVVTAPGSPQVRTSPVVEALRDHYGHVLHQHPATVCHEPADRAAAVARLAAEADLVLVVGAECADSTHLLARIRDAGARCHLVNAPHEVRPSWLRRVGTVGLTCSTAAPPGMAERIARCLTGLGPSTVVDQTASTIPITLAQSPAATRV